MTKRTQWSLDVLVSFAVCKESSFQYPWDARMLRTEIGAWRRLIFLYGAHILRGGFIGSFDRGGHCAAFYFKPTLWVSRWIAARASARAFFYNPHQVGLNIGRTAKSKWDEPFALRNQVTVENTIVQVGINLPEWNYYTGWRSRNPVL